MRWLMGIVPLILLIVSLFFTLVPEFSLEAILDNYILIISTVVCIGIGEIMVFHMSQKDKQKKLARKKKAALKSGR